MSRRPPLLAERRWKALMLLVALALGQAAAMVAAAFATRAVFISLRDGSGVAPGAALVMIALAGVLLCLLRALEGRVGEAAGQSYAAAIRRRLFVHVSNMPVRAIARRRPGALALRYVGDLAAFKGWIARGVSRLICATITIPAALLILCLLDPWLMLAALGPIAAVMIAIFLLSRPLGAAHADLRRKRARLAADMSERLPQGIQLRRSGRMRIELRALARRSHAVADAGVRREGLSALVRALPDAGAGLAGAMCLLVCARLNLGLPDAVAALTALGMAVRPLRHLADVADRRRAYGVASRKLDAFLASTRLPRVARARGDTDAPALRLRRVRIPGLAPFDLRLNAGDLRRLSGPAGCGKSTLLLALAGCETVPKAARFEVCGGAPGSAHPGRILYLGRLSPVLKGSLRREVTLGIGRRPSDEEIGRTLAHVGLHGVLERLGGLSGAVSEGRRNLTTTEQARLLLARALLARPALALIDADEIHLTRSDLSCLLDHLDCTGAAALIVTRDREAIARLGAPVALQGRTAAPVQDV
ncbi:MAG: ABC transporter transmembrane domain-containing protein [Pseudomonadota bacterium]